MHILIVGVLTLIRKLPLIIVSVLLGGACFYFFKSPAFSIGISTVFCIGWYFWFTGPAHHVSKKKLAGLVAKGLLVKLDLSPYSQEFGSIPFKGNWQSGLGVFERFAIDCISNFSNEGVFFHTKDMPYLSAYLIPWKHIDSIKKDASISNEFKGEDYHHSYLVKLSHSENIIIPISSDCIKHFSNIKNVEVQN